MTKSVCRKCGLRIGLLLGNPPSFDDVTLCQDCFFTGSSKKPEQTPHATATGEDNFLLTLLFLYPKYIWHFTAIVIAFWALPFVERDFNQWNHKDWRRAILIFALEVAVFSIILWIVGVLPGSSDADPYWY